MKNPRPLGMQIGAWALAFTGIMGILLASGFASEQLFSRKDREGNFFTVEVASDEGPIPAAEVFIGIHRVGWTDGMGIYNHYYTTRPRQSLTLAIRKPGFLEWSQRVRVRPGTLIPVRLNPDSAHRLTLKALTERFGVLSGIVGMQVYLDGILEGLTDRKGEFVYSRQFPGFVEAEIRHPQDLAPPWKARIPLGGDLQVKRFFYPVEPEIVRVAFAPFRTNGYDDGSLQADLQGIQESLADEISRWAFFKVLSEGEISERLEGSALDWNRLRERGWDDTDLRWDLDLILLGSATREDGYVVEVVALLPGGEELFRVLGTAVGTVELQEFAEKLGRAVTRQYPFRGTILDVEEDRVRVRFGGTPGWDPAPGTVLRLFAHECDESGRRIGRKPVGKARIEGNEDGVFWARVDQLAAGSRVSPGDLAVRYVPPPVVEEEGLPIRLRARAAIGSGEISLEGVNIYLNARWAGRTDRQGEAEVRVRRGESYRLDFYLHGYGPVWQRVDAADGSDLEVVLPKYTSLFRIHSDPPGASVWLDGDYVGKTPIEEAVPVPLGWHEIRLEAGRNYRPETRIVLFTSRLEDFTGDRMFVLEPIALELESRR